MTPRVPVAALLLAAAALPAACAAPPPAAGPHAYSVEVRILGAADEPVTAPRLLVFPGQRATVQVLRQESYVQSFDVERRGGTDVADPVVGTVHEGVLLEARVLPAAGGGGSVLEYSLRLEAPRRPFAERSLHLFPAGPVTVQTPEVERVLVEGALPLPDGEERLLALLPRPGGGGGTVSVRATVRRTPLPEEATQDGEFVAPLPHPPVEARGIPSPGWRRLRTVRLAAAPEPGSVVEGEALRALLAGGSVGFDLDLQWATPGEGGFRGAVETERTFLADYDVETGMGGSVVSPVLKAFTAGLLADGDAAEGLLCTLSSFGPVATFTTSLGPPGKPVTIDIPEIRVRRARALPGPGTRLLVLGPREDGGSDGVLLSFRPGATGPEE